MSEAVVAPPAAVPAAEGISRPSVRELFVGFAAISIVGFGGVLPFARQIMVDRRRWMTDEEFDELLGPALSLPGAATANAGIIFGQRIHGIVGSIAALTGHFLPPMAIVIALTVIYGHFGTVPVVRGVLAGITPAAAGLLFATGLRLTTPYLRRKELVPVGFTALALFAGSLVHVPLLVAFAALAPFSVAAAWRTAR
ncbi:MAG: chromate transporter [Chloroflexota bacterium]|nr:chromate transporter [Chloroflexota bacterium]